MAIELTMEVRVDVDEAEWNGRGSGWREVARWRWASQSDSQVQVLLGCLPNPICETSSRSYSPSVGPTRLLDSAPSEPSALFRGLQRTKELRLHHAATLQPTAGVA